MTTMFRMQTLIIFALLGTLSSLPTTASEPQAPEATAAEVAASFWDLPALEKAFIDTTPARRNDALPVGELGVDGGDRAAIVQLAREVADGQHGKYDSMLISHKGKLLFEAYFLRGRVNLPHFQASATKVYTSLALGRAIQLGYLTLADLDKPLVGFLNDLDPTKWVAGADTITLHKAMTMRSGIRISQEKRKQLEEEPESLKGQGLVQAWLEHSEPITAASQTYQYSWDPELVMQVLEAVVPGTARDFIQKELFDKMGITQFTWRDSVSGIPSAGDRLSMTSRDMLKWGALARDNGRWKGEQLIAPAYLTKATANITQPTESWQPDTYGYGYFWYRTEIQCAGKKVIANMAWGGGGQHLVVVPELELLVCVTGHGREDAIMAQIAKTIIPAFAKERGTL